MRYYGEDYKDSLTASVINTRDAIVLTDYSNNINQVVVGSNRTSVKNSCINAGSNSYLHISQVMDKFTLLNDTLVNFYTDVDSISDTVKNTASDIRVILDEVNGALVRINDALKEVGEYSGTTVTPSILASAGVNVGLCEEKRTQVWRSIREVEANNDVLTDDVVLLYVEYIDSLLESGSTIPYNDLKYMDIIYGKYLEQLKVSGTDLSPEEINRLNNLLDYYTLNRFGMSNDVNNLDEQRFQNCIDAYELLNPEAKDITDTFFSPAYELNDDEADLNVLKIKYALYTCDPEYRDIILSYMPRLRLDAVEAGGGVCYSPGWDDKTQTEGEINIDFFRENTGNFCSFFHEFGHAVDDLSCPNSDNKTNNTSESFENTMVSDLKTHMANTLVDLGYITFPGSDEVIDFFISNENVNLAGNKWRDYLPSDWSTTQILAFEKLRDYYGYREYTYVPGGNPPYTAQNKPANNAGFTYYNGILSDCIGGLTNNQIGGINGGHPIFEGDDGDDNPNDNIPNNLGGEDELHSSLVNYDYWYNTDGSRKNLVYTEFFAENFEYNVIDRSLTATRDVFGNSCNMFDEAINSIYQGL